MGLVNQLDLHASPWVPTVCDGREHRGAVGFLNCEPSLSAFTSSQTGLCLNHCSQQGGHLHHIILWVYLPEPDVLTKER